MKKLREQKGLNRTELGIASSISESTISRLERGQIMQLKSEALKRLAKALEVSIDYLVDNKQPDDMKKGEWKLNTEDWKPLDKVIQDFVLRKKANVKT